MAQVKMATEKYGIVKMAQVKLARKKIAHVTK